MNEAQKLYEKHETKLDRLYEDIAEGKLAKVAAFAEKYSDLLTLPCYGEVDEQSLLHMAASARQTQICALLLNAGLDANRTCLDDGHSTALELAASEGDLATCTCLLDAGAWPDGSPWSVRPPLYAAAQGGHDDVVTLLLERGARPDRLHLYLNRSPLDATRVWGHPSTERLLQDNGAHGTQDPETTVEDSAAKTLVNFVDQTLGHVLPAAFSPPTDDSRIDLHISLIDGKTTHKLLFTTGLYQATPMTELCLCLPGEWPLPQAGIPDDAARRFPVSLLERLAALTFEEAPLSEGTLILRSDPRFADLAWPEKADALLTVDKPWNKAADSRTPTPDSVYLLTLAPVAFTKCPTGKALTSLIERKRKGSWKTLALTLPNP
ncbi:ankyrin repeat domain-containing protein [Pseudomonas sp. S75]|uniref:ankyrin repeat domain-containing protein n=1 Tax=unclassified Pseudomonas TaxID=196821 RepID=UPI0019034023|nr:MULTISPECIES: ankyrin repeat domain-containing protein [unclassified Pseudomonas]MBJ9977375.1 ankyrin repeat domain-containing protein [Pseudomonas sp. S30]MBK0154813.1 ankyrin repeat domain-containing protein [Pseudomonas sp. S75]